MNRAFQHTTTVIALLFAVGLMLVPFHQHPHSHPEHTSESGLSIHSDAGSDLCFICTIPIHFEPAKTFASEIDLISSDETPLFQENSSISPLILLQKSRAPPVTFLYFFSG
jgi:hypothetical protein